MNDFERIRTMLGRNVNQMAESVGVGRQTWTYFERKHAGYAVFLFVKALMMLPAAEREPILRSVAARPLPKMRRRAK